MSVKVELAKKRCHKVKFFLLKFCRVCIIIKPKFINLTLIDQEICEDNLFKYGQNVNF